MGFNIFTGTRIIEKNRQWYLQDLPQQGLRGSAFASGGSGKQRHLTKNNFRAMSWQSQTTLKENNRSFESTFSHEYLIVKFYKTILQ